MTIDQLEKDMVKNAKHQTFAWTQYSGETFLIKEKREDWILAERLNDLHTKNEGREWKLTPDTISGEFKAKILKY